MHLSQPGHARKFIPLASKPPKTFARGTCVWGLLLCVGTQTKPPSRQQPKSAPAYSQLSRFLLSSSTPQLLLSTTAIALQTSYISNLSLRRLLDLSNTTHTPSKKQEPLLRMTIRSPDGALSRYLLPNGFLPQLVLL